MGATDQRPPAKQLLRKRVARCHGCRFPRQMRCLFRDHGRPGVCLGRCGRHLGSDCARFASCTLGRSAGRWSEKGIISPRVWGCLSMNRPLTVVTLAIAVFAVSGSANACSMAGCLGEGVETRSNFVVAISHGGKPLTGVAIQISGNGKQFTVFTTSDGKARIDDLPAGLYWLDAQFLGIGAAYDCFHVADRPTNKAKRRLAYTWGDE